MWRIMKYRAVDHKTEVEPTCQHGAATHQDCFACDETEATPETAALKARIESMDVKAFNVFHGSNPNVTPEQVAAEINRALDAIERSEFEEVVF